MYQNYLLNNPPRILERRDLPFPGETVIAIGNFDGVHIGHRALLEKAQEEAKRRKLPLLILYYTIFFLFFVVLWGI